jgi:hypothetical protein
MRAWISLVDLCWPKKAGPMVKAMAIVAKKRNSAFIRYSRLKFHPLPETASTSIRCGYLKELGAGLRRWFSDGRAHFFSPSAFARAAVESRRKLAFKNSSVSGSTGFHSRACTGSRGSEAKSKERGDCNWPSANGRPISGVLGTAVSCATIGSARKEPRPALTALANALAIWTGSFARETAVFSSTPSKPHSIT